MDAAKKAALAEALNALIQDADADAIHLQMQGVMELVERGIPVQLTGRPGVLNPLIELAGADPAAYERVMELVDRKRSERGLEPLAPPEMDRRGYMREFMQHRRERLRRLVDAVNSVMSEHDKIRGPRRLELERQHAARWMTEKAEREAAMRAKFGRQLKSMERSEIAHHLWVDVDAEIDALETWAQAEIRKPLSARSKAGFKFQLGMKGH